MDPPNAPTLFLWQSLWPVVLAEESPTGACYSDAWKQEGTSAANGAELSVVWLGITQQRYRLHHICYIGDHVTVLLQLQFFLTRQKLHFFTYICMPVFFFRFFSLVGYCKILSKVPRTIQ